MLIFKFLSESMAHLKNFINPARNTRTGSKILLVASAVLFLAGTSLLSQNSNLGELNITRIGRPVDCYPQKKQKTKEGTPTLSIQLDTFGDKEIWRALLCCVQHSGNLSAHKEVLCGRYGCCPKSCYSKVTDLVKHIDVTSDPNKAFFVETSTSARLNFRQACAVESLAKLNPHLSVYVLFTTDSIEESSATSKALIENYSNVHLRTLYPLGEFFTGTPLEHWYYCSDWNYGPYAVSHLSDALRFMTLYKYGGYYFDLDVISIRSLPDHAKNFVILQNEKIIEVATLHIEKGHRFAEENVREFVGKYNASIWGFNGPDVVRRTMVRFCRSDTFRVNETCEGVTMLPRDTFFPISWDHQMIIFAETDELPDLKKSFNGAAIGIHMWNKGTSEKPVRKKLRDNQLYANLAATNCPNVFNAAPELF